MIEETLIKVISQSQLDQLYENQKNYYYTLNDHHPLVDALPLYKVKEALEQVFQGLNVPNNVDFHVVSNPNGLNDPGDWYNYDRFTDEGEKVSVQYWFRLYPGKVIVELTPSFLDDYKKEFQNYINKNLAEIKRWHPRKKMVMTIAIWIPFWFNTSSRNVNLFGDHLIH